MRIRAAVSAPATLLLVALALAVLPLIRAGAPGAAAQSGLEWRACDGRFQCATLEVPLDYGHASGRQIDLALVRQPARDPSRRIGSLLVNPGGPGASGVAFAEGVASAFPTEVQQRFDIVGFDPRGVGASTPLACHDDIQQLAAVEPEPVTDDQWAQVVAVTRAFVSLCAQRGADLLPHLGSLDVVHDMERIREALGDQRLTYLGYSYGTMLGALYADRYPAQVRAIVLDGPVDLGIGADEQTAAQAVGFERAIDGFVASCHERGCPLEGDGANAWDAVAEVIARARDHPIPARGADRPAGPGEVLLGAVQALYRPASWSTLERAVTSARAGDATTFVRLADSYLGRRGGTYGNEVEMNSAVNCLDSAYSRDLAHYRVLADRIAQVAPRIGRSMAPGGLVCALWPVDPQPVRLLGTTGAPAVLIIGTTEDPATPYEWALGLRRELPSSVLLTHEGDGHTIYLSGSRCVDDVVDTYLLTLATPRDGAICDNGSGPPRAAPTPPALAASPTPVLAAATVGASSTATSQATAGVQAPAATPPAPAREQQRDRAAEGATALRLLAVVVVATLVALIVVTRRRLMRF
jgi:pimeloyl-ACP methyl ester carboxylesterase